MAVPAENIELQTEVKLLEETVADVPTTPGETDARKKTVKAKWYRQRGVWGVAAVTVLCVAGGLLLYPLLNRPWYEEDTAEHNMNQTSRIVGGQEARPNSWPYEVSLQYKWFFWWYHYCGGILVGKRTVLTAAHCFDWDNAFTRWAVVLGEHDLNTVSDTEQFITVLDYTVHPNYNMYNIYKNGADLALLYLSSDAILTDSVKLAPLPPDDLILPHNTKCYVVGWGMIYSDGPISPKLKELELSVVDRGTCSSEDYWNQDLNKNTICALRADPRDSACNGDSGGALTCPWNGKTYVFGAASFVTIGCTTQSEDLNCTLPNVFSRIAPYIEWMHKEEKIFQHKHDELRK